MQTEADLLSLIERAAEARRIKPSTLCMRALGDKKLPERLRAGGSMTIKNARRLLAYLEANP
jgi:hypothetical protein